MTGHDKPTRILVTGASGFIGRSLVRHLSDYGVPIVAQMRRPTDLFDSLPTVVSLICGIENLLQHADDLADVSHIVHLAADPRYGNGQKYKTANVQTTEDIIRFAQALPSLRRLIFVSSNAAVERRKGDPCTSPMDETSDRNPSTDYGRSKLEGERLVAESGLHYSIVRPCMVVGRDMRSRSHVSAFITMALKGHPLTWFRLPGRASFVEVNDLCAAIWVVATNQDAIDQTYFAAGSTLAFHQIFQMAKKRKTIPLRWSLSLLRLGWRWLPYGIKVLFSDAMLADDRKLRELGWRPRYSGAEVVSSVLARQKVFFDFSAPVEGWSLVTGAASGLGRSVAQKLALRGRKLLLLDKDGDALSRVLVDYPDARRLTINLANRQEVLDFFCSDLMRHTRVDEAYLCAGIGLRADVVAGDLEKQINTIDLNLVARLEFLSHLGSLMRQRQFGRIVMISSSSAFQAMPHMAVYAASNSAILALGEGAAEELRNDQVQVLTVCPGGMQTKFQKTAGVKEKEGERLMSPDQVADALLKGLAGHRTLIMPSLRSKSMALVARIMPRALNRKMWKLMMGTLR